MLFAHSSPTQTDASPVLGPSATEWLASISRRVGAWASACADYYSAAALYDELRGLSDAELRRRGLSRDTLARDACQACDMLGHR
jgi:hypothetical protein